MSVAEVVVLRKFGHQVTVTLEPAMMHGRMVPAYVIATDTGYRAVLEACGRDECAAGDREPCPILRGPDGQHPVDGKRASVDRWLEHCRTRCHFWHECNARTMAEEVLKTYRRTTSKPGPAGITTSAYRTWAWAKGSTQ
jgi:hypothetical protein